MVCMEFLISRDPLLHSRFLLPSIFRKAMPCPVKGRTTTYHFWARNALYHGLGVLGLKPGDKILVPAFHCRTVVEPVIQFGCKVVYYNVHRDGSVDFEDITRKIDSQTKAIIAVHYFGVLQPVHQLRTFCQQYELFLIEDCAHILMGDIDGDPIGSFGDISIFSWRKFFPVHDGGLLVCNAGSSKANIKWEKLDVWFQMKFVKNLIEKFLCDLRRQRKNVSLDSYSFSITPEGVIKKQEDVKDPVATRTQVHGFDYSQLNWPMSRWSKSIIKKIDISSVVRKRKENARILLSAFRSLPDIQSWATLEESNVCSWAFPLITPTRNDLHVKLRERGIQAFTWSGAIHPSLPLGNFPDAKFLYEHLVLLPNQQSLAPHDLQYVIEQVKEILAPHVPHQLAVLQ